MKLQDEHSFFFFLTYGGTEIQGHKLLVQDHTARNGPSRYSKLSLSPKTVFFSLYQRKQINFNSCAQYDALVEGECCVKKHSEAGPVLRGQSAVNSE